MVWSHGNKMCFCRFVCFSFKYANLKSQSNCRIIAADEFVVDVVGRAISTTLSQSV